MIKKSIFTLLICMVIGFGLSGAVCNAEEIRPVTLGQAMPEFSLPLFPDGELALASLQGKNVMMIFPRGLAGKDHWCHVCNYQYAELVEMEKKHNIREKLNVEILFVLPYSAEMVKEWVAAFPQQFLDIKNWKYPPEPEKLNDQQKQRAARVAKFFPKDYMYEAGKVPTPFSILVDADRTLTNGLGIFTMEWSGSKIEQNIPTIIILDKAGVVQFKYMSQNTFDRPSAEYLFKVISVLENEK